MLSMLKLGQQSHQIAEDSHSEGVHMHLIGHALAERPEQVGLTNSDVN